MFQSGDAKEKRMADKNGDGQKEIPREIPFVTEQIVKQSGRKRWLLKILKTMVLAMIFGITAGVSFALVLLYVPRDKKIGRASCRERV